MSSRVLLATVAAVLLLVAVPVQVNAFDFEFIRASSTTACINFRGSPSAQWGYVSHTGISERSAERFCRTYMPSSVTGVITNDYDCYVSGGNYRYTTTIDCKKDEPLSSCNVTGSTSPTYSGSYFYGAGISCITESQWDYYSSFYSSTTYLIANGTYGTQTGRYLTLKPTVSINSIRPSYSFSSGTICIPPTATEQPGSNLAKALCRTAGLPASPNSTIGNGTYSSSGYQKYASNIQCTSSSTATLFNGGCTNTTHYYDEPTTPCSPYVPQVSCPVKFDIKLGDTITSGSGSGYQLVQLRAEGSDDYDGTMCISSSSSSYTSNFANVMCREMYGDDIDFAGAYTSYADALPSSTKEYLSSVSCTSSTYTKLSQCYATINPVNSQYPCSINRGMVACKLNHNNIVLSIAKESSTSSTYVSDTRNPGKGYLMAAVSVAGQTTPAAVCSDGFNQIAALAACRSVGYTPGPNAFFTVATSTFTHAINNVTCPSTAKNLTECKLQYSGTGYKISYAASQVCAGRVYLDCDLGTPSVQFRMDSSRYLQARLYADSEWGWVDVGYGVTSQEGYDAMCQYSTSITGDSSITKSFLSVSYCSSPATSYTDCTYEYTDGVPGTSDYYCSSDNAPSSPSRSRSSSRSSTGFGTGGIVGVAVGVPIGIIFLVCLCIFLKKKKTPPPGVNNGIEMTTTSNQLPSVPSNPAVYNFASQSGAGGAAPASGGGIYGSSVASPASATTNNWNNAYNSGNSTGPGSPFGYSPNQGPPADYPPPLSGGYFPQHQAYPGANGPPPQYGGGSMYGQAQPVMGTAYNGGPPPPFGGDMYGSAPYPLGMPVGNNPPPTAQPYGSGGYYQ